MLEDPKSAVAALLCLAPVALLGCGDDEAPITGSSASSTSAPSAEPIAAEATDEAAPETTTDEAPESGDDPVDLLHAVPSTVSASTVYDDDPEQVARLVDGDHETAWNSASGALSDSYLEIEVPANAEIAGIELTAGYTKRSGERDLFTMNHRVGRVRVMRGSTVVAEQALDIEDREMQPVAFETTGGLLRIELLDVTEGSRSDWREVCVSELRVLGQAPGAAAGGSEPETMVGPIAGPGLQEAWAGLRDAREEYTRLREASEDDSAPEGPLMSAKYDYARAWTRELFERCEMPRLEEGWDGVGRRWGRLLAELSSLEGRLSGLEARRESGEATDRELARLTRLDERWDGAERALDRTTTQADDLLEQMVEHMCNEAREELGDLERPTI